MPRPRSARTTFDTTSVDVDAIEPFYSTPPDACRYLALVLKRILLPPLDDDDGQGMRLTVLDAGAGQGSLTYDLILRGVAQAEGSVLVELNPDRAEVAQTHAQRHLAGVAVIEGDYKAFATEALTCHESWDAAVMDPPPRLVADWLVPTVGLYEAGMVDLVACRIRLSFLGEATTGALFAGLPAFDLLPIDAETAWLIAHRLSTGQMLWVNDGVLLTPASWGRMNGIG